MSKKITVMVSDDAYKAMRGGVPARQMGAFISRLVEEYWHEKSLESQYVEAAKDQGREQEAKEWEELSIRDGKNAAW